MKPAQNDREGHEKHPRFSPPARGSLAAVRLDEIRERLRERAYDTTAVLEATAREILARSDL